MEEAQLQLEDNKEKLNSLRKAFEEEPDNRDAATSLAQFYVDLNWLNQAIDVYKEILKKNPDDFSLLLDYGNVLVQRDELKEALNIFKKLTVIKPNRVEGWNNLGIVYLKEADNDAAREAFKKVLSIEKDNAGALLNMGNYYHMRQDVDKAIEYFRKAVTAQVDFSDAWFNLGNAYITKCKYEKAIDSFKKALRYFPEFSSAYKNLGFAYEQLNKFDEAIKNYEKALDLNKADGGIYVNLANVFTKQGKLDKAKQQYLNAVRLSPKEPSGWMGLRDLAIAKGDVGTYVRSTNAILPRLQSDTIAEALGILRRLGKFDQVDEILDQTEKLEKEGIVLDTERLLAHQRKDPKSRIVRMLLKKLISIPDPLSEVTCALAEYYLTDGKYEKAYELLQKIYDDDVSHNVLIWRSLICLKRWEEAEDTINNYLKNHPDYPECWFYLAKIKSACKDKKGAEKYLVKALENGFSDNAQVEEDDILNEIFKSFSNSELNSQE